MLEKAAQAHSEYMARNRILYIRESSDRPGYTGEWPPDRATAAGYRTRLLFESVSASSHFRWERDRLFASIYRRFGFLNMEKDEIGIGVKKGYSTYDLGTGGINRLCQNPSYTGPEPYLTGICDNPNKRVKKSDFDRVLKDLKRSAPSLILWPPRDSRDIPPALYDELPDPLPDDAVSGLPISVAFNSLDFDTPPQKVKMTLKDREGEVLEALGSLTAENDPAHKLTPYQFALMPKQRLKWGRNYYVELRYRYGGRLYHKAWCFSTRSLREIAERYYRIEGGDETELSLQSGKRYAIYIVPENTQDLPGKVRWNTRANIDLVRIDPHTLLVTLSGELDEQTQLIFANGLKLNLIVASGDNAETPDDENCFDDKMFNPDRLSVGLREEKNGNSDKKAPDESNAPQQENNAKKSAPEASAKPTVEEERNVTERQSLEANGSREENESNKTLSKLGGHRSEGKGPEDENPSLPSEAEEDSFFDSPFFLGTILMTLLYPILRLLIRRNP
jgi:hypothetical protein